MHICVFTPALAQLMRLLCTAYRKQVTSERRGKQKHYPMDRVSDNQTWHKVPEYKHIKQFLLRYPNKHFQYCSTNINQLPMCIFLFGSSIVDHLSLMKHCLGVLIFDHGTQMQGPGAASC